MVFVIVWPLGEHVHYPPCASRQINWVRVASDRAYDKNHEPKQTFKSAITLVRRKGEKRKGRSVEVTPERIYGRRESRRGDC